MIRLKSKDADIKRTYAQDLWAAVGFVVLLLAAVVAINPRIALSAAINPRIALSAASALGPIAALG